MISPATCQVTGHLVEGCADSSNQGKEQLASPRKLFAQEAASTFDGLTDALARCLEYPLPPAILSALLISAASAGMCTAQQKVMTRYLLRDLKALG